MCKESCSNKIAMKIEDSEKLIAIFKKQNKTKKDIK